MICRSRRERFASAFRPRIRLLPSFRAPGRPAEPSAKNLARAEFLALRPQGLRQPDPKLSRKSAREARLTHLLDSPASFSKAARFRAAPKGKKPVAIFGKSDSTPQETPATDRGPGTAAPSAGVAAT